MSLQAPAADSASESAAAIHEPVGSWFESLMAHNITLITPVGLGCCALVVVWCKNGGMTTYDKNGLIGVNEAARILGLSRQGVQRRIDRGQLVPVSRLGKRRIAILSRKDVEAQPGKRGTK